MVMVKRIHVYSRFFLFVFNQTNDDDEIANVARYSVQFLRQSRILTYSSREYFIIRITIQNLDISAMNYASREKVSIAVSILNSNASKADHLNQYRMNTYYTESCNS